MGLLAVVDHQDGHLLGLSYVGTRKEDFTGEDFCGSLDGIKLTVLPVESWDHDVVNRTDLMVGQDALQV